MTTDRHEAARLYHRMGLPITICRGKVPIGGKAWHRRQWTLEAIDREFCRRADRNVGCRFGEAFMDFDGDGPDAADVLLDLFDGDPPVTPTFQSRRGRHWLFERPAALDRLGKTTMHFGDLELRIGQPGMGCQSLLPPSETDGFTRKWLVSIEDCRPAPLPESAILKILERRLTEEVSVPLCTSLLTPSLSVNQQVERAIELTSPTETGHRHRQLFHFARHLQAIPSLAGAELATLKPLVRKWHERALPKIATKEFELSWLEFADSWGRVKFPAGQEPIRQIYQNSLSGPLPAAAANYDTDPVIRLVCLCRELQRLSGHEPFYLSCRAAGELLNVSYVQASKYLRVLVTDKVLEIAERGKQGRAMRYRYVGD